MTEIVERREIYPPALPPLQMASKTSLVENSVQNCHVPFGQFSLIYRESGPSSTMGPGIVTKKEMEHNFTFG